MSNFYFCVSIALLFISLFGHINGDSYDYAMVIDAGSTGSRLYLYRFEPRITSTDIPPQSSPIQIAHGDRTGPISAINTQSESNALISTLISSAKQQLAADESRWYEFPIYLKATAGMRVLPNDDRAKILRYIANSFSDPDINPFRFDTTYAIIASGEEEATFDWLGVNFIYDTLLNNDSDASTYGALDLGGQSTQIAFAPEPQSNILAEFTAVRLWEKTHRLYTRSFLRYGTNAITDRIAQIAYDEAYDNNDDNVTNACLNPGVNDTFTVQDIDGNFILSTQFGDSNEDLTKCIEWVRSLFANETDCYVEDCAFNGVYLPEIPPNMTFIAFSAFGYAISGLNLSQTINLREFYYKHTVNICNMTLDELRASKYHNRWSNGWLSTYCLRNTYIFVLLHEGYGFDIDNTPIIFTNEHNDMQLSWTQGSILRDVNWLPYDIEYNYDDQFYDDGLTKEGKVWRIVGIAMIAIATLACLGYIRILCKKDKESD